MHPLTRLTLYTLAAALSTGLFVWAEISSPGSLRLQVFAPGAETLGTSEFSPLELIQIAVLVVCAALFGWVASISPAQRPVAVLFGGIAVLGAIRECDYFLDRFVADNFWQFSVGILGALLAVYTWRHNRRLQIGLLRLWPGTALSLLFAGALVQFVFAQLIGHEPLWRTIAGDAYQRVVKVGLEEFIEWIGYLLWLIGTIEYVLQARELLRRDPPPRRRR